MFAKCLQLAVAFSLALSGVAKVPTAPEQRSDGKQTVTSDDTGQTLFVRTTRSAREADLWRSGKRPYQQALCHLAAPLSYEQPDAVALAHVGPSAQWLSLRSLHVKLQV